MTADSAGDSPPAQTPLTPNELVIRRLKDARAALDGGISTYQLAERLAALTGGGGTLSTHVLQNLEAGRRQGVTVAELLLLAAGLSVPPEFFLVPAGDDRVQVTPSAVLGRDELLSWIRGQQSLPGGDAEHFAAVSADTLGAANPDGNAALKAEFLRHAAGLLDGFLADSDVIVAKTREQVRDLLTELRTAVADGTGTDNLLAMIDDHLRRLPTE
jgi:hypothetical protein